MTIALTRGLLVPAKLSRKLYEDSEIHYGFANSEYANYTERNFVHFQQTFNEVIFSSVDLMLLFDVDNEVMKHDFDLEKQSKPKRTSSHTQTNCKPLASNQLNATWNVWDYHRETIRLANMRQKQTHSSQSKYSFGHRNAQNQACNMRGHLEIQRY